MTQFKIVDLNLWQAFVCVAKQGNFSKAAVALNLSLAQMSKRVSHLEEALGARLFNRSTRVVSLSEEGRILLPKAELLLSDATNLASLFDSKKTKPSGRVRISAVPFLADHIVIPLITLLSSKYPQISIDLDLSEHFVDLIESNVDIALRIDSSPSDSSLIYKKLMPHHLICCASPKYLSTVKQKPKKPKDLKGHQILALQIHKKCRFGRSEMTVGDLLSSRFVSIENGAFLQKMALNHLGVLIRSEIEVKPLIKSGHLVPLLEDFPLDAFGNVFAVIPSRRLLAPRVSVVVSAIEEIVRKLSL